MVQEVNDMSTFRSLHSQHKDRLIVVDFFATWCGPCQQVAPLYASLSQKYAREAVFLKCDCDKGQDIAREAGVKGMPSFGFYVNGELLKLQQGGNPAELEANIKGFAEKYSKYAFKGQGHVLGATSNNTPSSFASSSPARAAPAASSGRKNPWADPNFFPKSSAASKPSSSSPPAASAAAAANPAHHSQIPAASLEKLTAPPSSSSSSSSTAAPPSSSSSAPVNPPSSDSSLVPSSHASSDPRIRVHSVFLSQLQDMGFAPIRAEKSLIITNNRSLEAALEWLSEHQDDKDIDEKLEVVGQAAKAPAGGGMKDVNLDAMDEDDRVIYEQLRAAKKSSSSSSSSSPSDDPAAPKVPVTANMTHEEKMQWLENRKKEVRERKEREALEKEKNSYKSTKQLTHAVQDMKEQRERDAAKIAMEKKRKEEAEALKAKREIQAKIAADKERRKKEQEQAMAAAKALKAAQAAQKK